MELLCRCVFLVLLINVTVSIIIKNGGYENVYILVQDSNEENELLLERIQEVFTDASKLMFSATRNMIYFRRIRIVVPKSWSAKPEYKQLPTPSLSKQYIIVDKEPGKAGIKTPHVRSTLQCGVEGIYMYLNAPDFILKEGFTNWGQHDHVLVHEWGHLRWGLLDEYITKKQSMVYQDGTWQPVRCSGQIKGRVGKGPGCATPCNTKSRGEMMKNCRFCPYPSQSVNASLMSHSYLEAMTMFCDADDISVDEGQRHNGVGQSMHNTFCQSKSAWEIMRNHADFQTAEVLPESTNTKPEFEIIRSSEVYRVFVLDVSGSMNPERLRTLRQTGEYVIQEVISEGSWLGIVTFSTTARTIKTLTQIKAQSDRDVLKASLPYSSSGSTCIGCGMEEAIKILKLELGTAENTELIVISDGLNNVGNLQVSINNAKAEKVIVHTIAVTQQADTLLAHIAEDTGGKHYAYQETGNISFVATFSEAIQNDMTSIRTQHIMLVSEKIDSASSDTLKFVFQIENGLGANTSVTVTSNTIQNFTLELTGPEEYTQISNIIGTYTTLVIPDVAKAGQYEMKISMQERNQSLEYYVKTTPTSNDIVRVTSWLSSSRIHLSSGELPIIFVDVRKGYAPLIDATVTALVESDNNACELPLKDEGNDQDILSNDGIYSEYILPHCLRNGRISIKVFVSGQKGETKIVKHIYGAPTLVEVDDPPETYSESFQRVQIMEELYITGYNDTDTDTDIVSPGRITDVDIYHIVKQTNQNEESRYFTISWTATGDDKNIGQASSYIMRLSDDFNTLLNNFDSAELLDMNNNSFPPREAGQTEALKLIINAEQSYTDTAFFAIQAVDEVGNKGAVSNIVPIVVAKGYRAFAEPGSLEIDPDNVEVVEDASETTAIIAGLTTGAVLILICVLVFYICRKRRFKGSREPGAV